LSEADRLTIRPMVFGDAEAVVAMHAAPAREGFVGLPTVERIRERIADPAIVNRIMEVEGRAVGMLAFGFVADWLVEFHRIVVSEPGRGYGRIAVEYVKHFAFEESGAHRLYLEVVAQNSRARRLYESCGFVLEGTWRDGFRDIDGRYSDLCAYGILASEARA
jgi:RimJ/RimL family protein N-acetyltransferase